MENLFVKIKDDDVSVKAVIEDSLSILSPETLRHSHDDRARFLHIVDHLL